MTAALIAAAVSILPYATACAIVAVVKRIAA